MEESYSELDYFIIKDKEYWKEKNKKRIKISLITILILIIVAIITYVIYRILTHNYGKINCIYITNIDEETIDLINISDENINFILKIDDEKEEIKNKNSYTFKKAGKHLVTFIFKTRLTSLENFFNKKNSLIEADLSELDAEQITSLKRMFFKCKNLTKVKLDFKESSNIENMMDLFKECSSLDSIMFNFDISKVIDMRGIFQFCSSLTTVILLLI